MLVIADTTPLNYLLLIGQVDILPTLYTQVVIPSAVATELQHPKAPGVVRNWIANLPSWGRIQSPREQPAQEFSIGAGHTVIRAIAAC